MCSTLASCEDKSIATNTAKKQNKNNQRNKQKNPNNQNLDNP